MRQKSWHGLTDNWLVIESEPIPMQLTSDPQSICLPVLREWVIVT